MCVHAFVFPRDEPAQGLARPKYMRRAAPRHVPAPFLLEETVSPSLFPQRISSSRQRESPKSRIINLWFPRRENISIFSPLSLVTRKDFLFLLFWFAVPLYGFLSFSLRNLTILSPVRIELPETRIIRVLLVLNDAIVREIRGD